MIIVHYEVYVLESRGWMLHARFPRQERDEAIKEAKEIEATINARVKVLRETYYTDTNVFDEAEVYLSGRNVAARQDTKKAAPAPAAGRTVSRPAAPARKPGTAAPPPRRRAAQEPKTITGAGNMLFRLTMITLASVGSALAALRAVPDIVVFLYDYGVRIGPDAYGQLLFAVFVLVFLMVGTPLSLRFLPRNPEIVLGRPSFGWNRNRDSGMAGREMKQSLDKLVDRAAEAPTPAKEAEDEPPPPVEDEILPEILPDPEETLPEILPDPDEPPPPQPDADHAGGEQPPPVAAPVLLSERDTPAFESLNVVAMRFLGSAVAAMKTMMLTLDKFNKFALNLYMAGAVDTLGESKSIDAATQKKLLAASLETLGTPADLAARFHDKLDDYMLEPRYMQLIQAGRNAMTSWLAGEEIDAHGDLSGTMKEWGKPPEKKASIMTLMFTDMVGSTDLTQARGDMAAQEVVRRHNSIVRSALAQFNGKEVKHTGDGIMASFASAAAAVEASIAIQRQVAATNGKQPDLGLHLRIGLNAGEPIQEEDDLFGTTVQLAARVCAATATDQTLCTQVVKDLNSGKAVQFRSAGEHALKGFREKMTLWEVAWR
jgi:adenylate cyclase